MPNIGAPEIIIIAIVVLILFGTKKLPDASRAVGRSMRIFKSETKGLRDDEGDGDEKETSKHTSDETAQQHKPAPEPQQLAAASDTKDESASGDAVVDGQIVDRQHASESR